MARVILSVLMCVLALSSVYAGNFYWVGGNSNWNNAANWSATSGGAGGAGVPAGADDVFLDANSGASTVSIDVAANANSIDTTGFTGSISVGANSINVTSSVICSAGASWNGGTGNVTIGGLLTNNGFWTMASGTVSYADVIHTGSTFDASAGVLNCGNLTVNATGFDASAGISSSGTIYITLPSMLGANITSMGDITIESGITLTATTTFNSNNNNINLETPSTASYNSLDGAFDVSFQAGTGNLTLPGDVGGTTMPTQFDVTGAAVVNFGEASNTSPMTINVNGFTDFSGATSISLHTNTTIMSNNNALDFGAALIDGAHDLTLNSGTGALTRNGAIGSAMPLTQFAVTSAATFNSTGNITVDGNLDVSGATNIVIYGTQTWDTSGGGSTADIAIDNVNINSNVASNHTLTFNAGGAVKMGTTQISQTTALSAVNFGTNPIRLIGPAVIGHAITHADPLIVDANATIDTGALAQTYTGPIEAPNGKFDLTLDTTAAIATANVGSASFPLSNFIISNGGLTANGEIFADAQDYSAAATVIIGADMSFNAEGGTGNIEFGAVSVSLGNNIARLRAGPTDTINFYGAMDAATGTLDFFGHPSTTINIADNIDVNTLEASPGTITFSGSSFWVTTLIHHNGEFIFDGSVASQTLNEGGHFFQFSKIASTTSSLNIGAGFTLQADDFLEINGNGNALSVQSTVGASAYNINAPNVIIRDINITDANNTSAFTHKILNGTDGGNNTNFLFGAPILTITKIGGDTDEDGGFIDLQVTLDAAPLSNVNISFPNPDPSEIVFGIPSLVLDSHNYNANNIIQVTGVADFVDDGDITLTVNFSSASADPAFNTLSGTTTFKNLDTANANAIPTAALFYVAPGGVGDGSSTQSPLGDIQSALNGTAPGDAVVLLPGTYNVASVTWPTHNVNMGGVTLDPTQYILDGGGTSNFASITSDVTGTGFRSLTFQNFSSASPGAVFNLSGSGELLFEKCVFKNNIATSGSGGGVFSINAASQVRMKGCLFENNSAAFSGGAITLNNGEFSARGCEFRGNTSDGAGGAIASFTSMVKLTGAYFFQNSINNSGYGGFAVYSEGPTGDFMVESSVFEANSGPGYGTLRLDGKINNNDGIRNCTFVNNQNTDGSAIGAGVKVTDTYPQGGSYCMVENSIFWGNTAPNNPSDAQPNVAMTAGTQLILETCIVQGPVGAPISVNNLVAGPPLFKDAANHDFMLDAGSPGINAARIPAATYDFFGRPRNLSVHPDLGAYERINVGEFAPIMQSGTTISDYRQLANPFHKPGMNPIEQVQELLGPFNDLEYRLYVWRHGPQAYQEGPNTSAASIPTHQTHGFPFWLISRSPIQLKFEGEIADHFEPYSIFMDPQWNMIGNPFLEEVPITSISFLHNGHPISLQNPNQTMVNPVIYRWNGTDYEQATSLKPFEAYWVENLLSTSIELVIEPPSSNHAP